MQAQFVPEIDVIISVAKWLHSEGWQLERVSVPRGRGIDRIGNKDKLEAEFTAVGISMDDIEFRREGEDIRARQGSNLWKIECKGLSSGKPTTDKNNFDRAIASAASYYTQINGLRLGLALPEWYKKYFRNKLPQALRVAISLWVFLYASSDEIYVFAPDEEIPA
ncbi:hypothetical protein ES703_29494 [subsurface metagenome]